MNGLVLFAAAVAIELVYRLQPVDLWRPELRRDNPELEVDSERPVVLVLGDSFSASPEGLAAALRESAGDRAVVIGSGVSGTTARDAVVMAPGRLRRFQPSVTVYQVYIGNDLLETRHPPTGGRASIPRRVYWQLIDGGWRSLRHLNYRLGQIHDRWVRRRADPEHARASVLRDTEGPFDPARYSQRERRLISLRPQFIAEQVNVSAWAARVWPAYERDLRRLLAHVTDSGSEAAIVVIPHCVQVSPVYRERFAKLGAALPAAVADSPSAFVRRLKQAVVPVPVIDAAPVLRAAEAAGTPTFRLHDPHLTREGQRALADHLARTLVPSRTPPGH
jgi:hypothetical protein